MTKEETFPLHRCIFRNDIDGLNENLKNEETRKLIDSRDNHGNTPLHLALMLDRRNCVLALLKNGCDCISRNNYGWNPLEEATMLGDMDLIEKLTILKFREYNKFFNQRGGTLDKWNESLPYFHFKSHIKFKSKIPLLNRLGIKDSEHFYKRGNNFRVDLGFSGIDLRGIPRMMKGSMSVILNFKESGALNVYLLDNKAKRYTELYPEIPQGMMESLLKSKMDIKTMYKFYADFSDFKVKKKSNKGFGFHSKKRVIKIGNKKYNTDIFKFKDLEVIIRKRDNEEIIGDYKSHIKTTVQDLDKSRMNGFGDIGSISKEINNTIFSGAEKQMKGSVMEDILKQEKEYSSGNDDSDSDSDDSDIEEDAKSESTSESSSSKLIEADNEFKKYIDANIYEITSINSEITDKVIQMIINGKDMNGNPIEKSDILYINQIVPSFYSSYIKENHLPADQQKELERIYNTIVKSAQDNSNLEKSASNSNLIQNLKKSNNITSVVHNFAGSYYNSSKKSSKATKYEETKKEPINEQEYFDPKNTESLHMGRVMEISEEKRHVKNVFKAWLTKENTFPVNAYQYQPLIDILCLIMYDQVNVKVEDNNYDRNIYYNIANHILKEIDGTKRFLLKAEIPVFPGTVFQYKFVDVEIGEKCAPENLFSIPSDYSYDETVSFKFLK